MSTPGEQPSPARTAAADPATAADPGGAVRGALLRYRVIAWVVGVGLIVLVLVGMPLKYAADEPAVVATVGPVHGFLYIGYLFASLDLALRLRWSWPRTVLVMLAGTVPFLSFVAERTISRQLRTPGH